MSDAARVCFWTTCRGVRATSASNPRQMATQSAQARCGQDRILHIAGEDSHRDERRWDCVVFNEVLYYAPSPLALLDKYSRLLEPGGIVIVSIYQKPGHGIRERLGSWLGGHTGTPSVRCTKKVHDFMVRQGWVIEEDNLVARLGGVLADLARPAISPLYWTFGSLTGPGSTGTGCFNDCKIC